MANYVFRDIEVSSYTEARDLRIVLSDSHLRRITQEGHTLEQCFCWSRDTLHHSPQRCLWISRRPLDFTGPGVRLLTLPSPLTDSWAAAV